MDISIIVPVYNAEKYLSRCLDSVLVALKNFNGKAEVLLIDNNSTDKSSNIMYEYKIKSPKIIHIYDQRSPGASATRNYGAMKAKGDYIWFIDADDTIRADSVAILHETAKKKSADLVMMGAKKIYPDGHYDYLSAVHQDRKDFKSRLIRYGPGPWQFIIKRSWWQKNNFKFHEGIIHEDMELLPTLILYTDNFTYVDEPLYNYFQNSESVLHKTSWDPHYFDIFPALDGLYNKFKGAKAIKKYHDEIEWFFIWNLLIDSAKDFDNFKEGRNGFRYSRKMLRKYFPKWRRNPFLKQKPLKLRLRVLLNYYR